jgi:enoyl-CoA hydratase/carnithine racemase
MPAVKQALRRKEAASAARGADVEVERQAGVLILTLARPERRNSLSEAMLRALQAGLDEAARDAGVRAVVIAAKGPAFCAGHDLKELSARRSDADGGRAYFARIMRQCAEMMRSIVRCPKPVIAAVQGPASAAGCQLVASCDLAVAAEGASFATPGVNIGLFCSTPMVALSRNVPRKRAMEMLLLGEMLPARAAADYGLVNRVVPASKLMEEALGLARLIASKPAATLAVGKEAFYRQIELPLTEAYDYAAGVMVTNMLHAEAKEGIGAFIDKRPPDWTKS